MSIARVREALADHRQAGLDFAAAWSCAMDQLEPDERREWLEALEATAEAAFEDLAGKWQAAILEAEQNRPDLRVVKDG